MAQYPHVLHPAPTLTGDRANQVSQITHWIEDQIAEASPNQNAAIDWSVRYQNYADTHPRLTALQAYSAWLVSTVGRDMLKVVGEAIGPEQAKIDEQFGEGTASGLGKVASHIPGLPALAGIADFLGRLTQANTWIRIAEALLGVGLLIVAVAKLAGNTAIGRTAAKAGKAAMIL